jgi:hypothetical protein
VDSPRHQALSQARHRSADVIPTLARQRDREDAAFAAEIAKGYRLIAALREEVASIRADLLRRRLAESKYNEFQPRIPKRNPGGGQWTLGGNGQSPSAGSAQPMGDVAIGDATGSDDTSGLLHITITPDSSDSEGVQLAGDLPDDPGNTPLDDPAPKVPRQMPETREGRMGFVRAAAGWVGRQLRRHAPAVDVFFRALDQVKEINALTAAVKSANDPARTLEELQKPIGSPSQAGYQDHHVVNQHDGNRKLFGDSRIDSRENLVRIPVVKHLDISAWYQTQQDLLPAYRNWWRASCPSGLPSMTQCMFSIRENITGSTAKWSMSGMS